MKSSSLKLVGAGIHDPRHYRDCLIHDWYLLSDYADHLDVFILRQTPTKTFFNNIQHGELKVSSKVYSITYIQHISKLKTYENLLLSLRFCKDLNRGYVLVKGLLGRTEFEQLVYNGINGNDRSE